MFYSQYLPNFVFLILKCKPLMYFENKLYIKAFKKSTFYNIMAKVERRHLL